jgi:hypothetical protein
MFDSLALVESKQIPARTVIALFGTVRSSMTPMFGQPCRDIVVQIS